MSKENVRAKKRQLSDNKMQSRSSVGGIGIGKAMLISTLCGVIAFVAVTAIMAYMLEKSSNPDSSLVVCSILATVITGAVCGIAAARFTKRPIPWSIAAGVIMIAVYFAVSLAFDPADVDSDTVFKTILMAALPLSALAAGVAVNGKKKKKGRK